MLTRTPAQAAQSASLRVARLSEDCVGFQSTIRGEKENHFDEKKALSLKQIINNDQNHFLEK